MRLYTIVAAAITFFAPVIAAPGSLVPVEKVDGETSGRLIVQLKPGVDQSSFLDTMNIVTTYNWTIINGFAGEFSEEQINRLRAHRDIELITEDGTVRTSLVATQNNAPWGLARLSSRPKLTNQNAGYVMSYQVHDLDSEKTSALNFTFIYESTAGAGVDIYILDTGINLEHIEFGGRARWGATFGGYTSMDENGHGTHVAGTAAGSSLGVARAAELIAVKVVGDDGTGFVSDIWGSISGLNWVGTQAKASGHPSVVSMSINANGTSLPLDYAVGNLTTTQAGVHVVVSAGNNNVDANNTSPCRAPATIVVGASNISDCRASFSNYGNVLDTFAPGENIISAYIGGPTALGVASGTSMAAAHVSGVVAYVISSIANVSPASMDSYIYHYSLTDVLCGVPSSAGIERNKLAQNGLAQNQTMSF